MAWTMEQAYPISRDVVLCVNLILFYFILFCMYVCKCIYLYVSRLEYVGTFLPLSIHLLVNGTCVSVCVHVYVCVCGIIISVILL